MPQTSPQSLSILPFPLLPGAQGLLGHSLKGYLRSLYLAEVRSRSGVDSGSRALCWLGLPRRSFGEALLTHTLQEAGVSFYILTPQAANWETIFPVFIHTVLGLIREQLIWADLQSFHLIQIWFCFEYRAHLKQTQCLALLGPTHLGCIPLAQVFSGGSGPYSSRPQVRFLEGQAGGQRPVLLSVWSLRRCCLRLPTFLAGL